VKLACDRQVSADLVATLRTCNEAANAVSQVAWDRRTWRNKPLRGATYAMVRDRFGLGSQITQLCIKKVADAYNSGKPEDRRGARSRRFRWCSAQPFDARNLLGPPGKDCAHLDCQRAQERRPL
jgi:putative transposase